MYSHCYDRLFQICEQSNNPHLFDNLHGKIIELSLLYPTCSVAYMIHRFTTRVWNDQQNGDMVWAIIREGRPVTTLLRRSTQRTWDFDTDLVICLL